MSPTRQEHIMKYKHRIELQSRWVIAKLIKYFHWVIKQHDKQQSNIDEAPYISEYTLSREKLNLILEQRKRCYSRRKLRDEILLTNFP